MYQVFSFVDGQFKAPLENFISTGTSNIANWVSGPLTAALTLYVVLYGYLVLRGSVLEIEVVDPDEKCRWLREEQKRLRLHGYWLYRGMQALVESPELLARIDSANFDANALAMAKAKAWSWPSAAPSQTTLYSQLTSRAAKSPQAKWATPAGPRSTWTTSAAPQACLM